MAHFDIGGKTFVAGHRGLVGSAVVRALRARGGPPPIVRTRAELDLTDQAAVHRFFDDARPDAVFLCAARVGGIYANSTFPAEFIRDNLAIQTNVIHAAWASGVRKLLFLGSSCIYPKFAPQPLREDALLTGPLESTNEAYAIAKIAGLEMCRAYRRQYGFDAIVAMPTNLYGPGDNYHPTHSHVVPAMLRRFHEARESGAEEVVLWGSGTPLRELLYADDLADALLLLMERHSDAEMVNIGSGDEWTIAALADEVSRVVGYTGAIRFDSTMPDGTLRKRLDGSRMEALGWRPRMSLAEGLSRAYVDWLDQAP